MFDAKSTDNSGLSDGHLNGAAMLDDGVHLPDGDRDTAAAGRKPLLKSLLLVAALTGLGGLSPWLLPHAGPATFTTEARIRVGTRADLSPETRALIQDHIGILTSQAGLDRVVRDLDLAADTSFDPRKKGGIDLLLDLALGKERSFAEGDAARRDQLAKSLRVTAGPTPGQVTVTVTGSDARQSARIANHVAKLFVADMEQTTTTASDDELENRRIAIETAQSALTGFTAAQNPAAVTEARRNASDIAAVDHQIEQTQARLTTLARQADDAKKLTLAEVTDKPSIAAMESPVLADLHQKYVAASMSVDQLAAALGPRHPRLLAAQAAVAQVRKDIQSALGRLGATTQEQIKAGGKDIEAFKARRAKLLAAQQATGVDAAGLQRLETAVDLARQNYLDYVQLQETAAPKTHTISAGILSPAAPAAAVTTGISVMTLSTSAALAGLGLGLFIVMVRLALRPGAGTPEVSAAAIMPEFEPGFLADYLPEPIETPLPERAVVSTQLPPRLSRHRTPANSSPLADHIRDVLQGGAPKPAEEVSPLDHEIRDLRLEMVALRERVADYTQRRSAARG